MVLLEQHKGLLTSQNPLSCSDEVGQWVCCHHRLYHEEIGFVQDIDHSQDIGVTVLFVPRVPTEADGQHSGKWKKGHQPNPHTWLATQIATELGTRVKEDSEGRFTFEGDLFQCGLVIKQITSTSLNLVNRAPDLALFICAPYLMDHPNFPPWL
jgi:hypothetical protein